MAGKEAAQLLREFDPNKLVNEVIDLGEAWAKADAAASSLEETRKSMLAKLTNEYMGSSLRSGGAGERPKAVSVSGAETKALSDVRYEQHIELMVACREEANRARVRYDMGKMRLELLRSQAANVRSEMNYSRMTT